MGPGAKTLIVRSGNLNINDSAGKIAQPIQPRLAE